MEQVTGLPDSGSFHFVTDGWSDVSGHGTSPEFFALAVYPNPFNSTLSISLDVPLHQEVTLSLYDLLGREVDVIYRGRLSSQTISYVAPAGLSSGVYFLRASAGAICFGESCFVEIAEGGSTPPNPPASRGESEAEGSFIPTGHASFRMTMLFKISVGGAGEDTCRRDVRKGYLLLRDPSRMTR
ncbi:MAG: T9SS type A sorting domain-containing protein [bacterium]|nr:T9SS type A sorting domain-containing protein [bacterium]